MKENKLVELSMDFAIKIIKLCETVKGHHSLVNQLDRSATSIGANIHEANYAHGKPDFIAKLQITLKECCGDCYVFDENGVFIEHIGDVGYLFSDTIESTYFQSTP